MRRELFMPSAEGEARLLLLIDGFSRGDASLDGRVKLAKLDFFLRYPAFFARALSLRAPATQVPSEPSIGQTIESRMVRYRYGPWDPAYYALLGRLVGKGLIEVVPVRSGLGYRASASGREAAERLAALDHWETVVQRVKLLKKHLDLSGTNLKNFIYDHFPEVTSASWGERL